MYVSIALLLIKMHVTIFLKNDVMKYDTEKAQNEIGIILFITIGICFITFLICVMS